MRFVFLLLTTILVATASYSQDFKLIKLDNKLFPTIKLTVTLSDNSDIYKLKVIEDNKEKLLKIDSVIIKKNEYAICYLIDINVFNEAERAIIFSVLSDVAQNLESGILINICFISANEQNNCIIPLSYEFTNNSVFFIEFAKEIVKQYPQTNKITDVNCGLSSAIDFIQKKKNLPNHKKIVILTKNITNITKVNQILKAGKDSQTDIKLLSNLEDTLTANIANFYVLQKKLDKKQLSSKLNRASDNKDLINIKNHKNYIVEFESTQNSFLNIIELRYGENTIKTTFVKPGKSKGARAIWFLAVIFILVVLIGFLIKKQIKQKRKLLSLKETVSLLFDKKMKILSTQTQTPVLEIKLMNDISNYHIKKIVTTIGRKKDCDILINDLTISSHHASITNEGGEFYIQDFESTNGIFVNDIKINKKVVKSGDIIRMGKAILTIHY